MGSENADDVNDLEFELSNYTTFYAIAWRNFVGTQKLAKDRDRREVQDDSDVDFVCLKNAQIQRYAMVTVIFSALTLESFINHYAITKFSRNFFINHLDKLDSVSKWVIVPKLSIGKSISSDGQAFEGLRKLFRLRNRLVHSKTRTKRIKELIEERDFVTENHALESIQTVHRIINELSALDSGIDTRWLEEAKSDPYA